MKYSITALIASLLLLHLHRVQSEEAEVTVFNQWPRGFYGSISVDIEDAVEDGWQVTLTFSKPVKRVEVWNAEVDSVSDDKTVYVLRNMFWNARLGAGSQLKFLFLGYKAKFRENKPRISAEFARLGEGSGF